MFVHPEGKSQALHTILCSTGSLYLGTVSILMEESNNRRRESVQSVVGEVQLVQED